MTDYLRNPLRKLPWELGDALLPMLIALVLYFGVLNAPFLYDDFLYVEGNTQIREVSNAPRLWITPYHHSGLYRPVTATSYLIDYFFFELDPRGFHLSNLLLYLMSIFFFGGDPRSRRESIRGTVGQSYFRRSPGAHGGGLLDCGPRRSSCWLILLLGADRMGKVVGRPISGAIWASPAWRISLLSGPRKPPHLCWGSCFWVRPWVFSDPLTHQT